MVIAFRKSIIIVGALLSVFYFTFLCISFVIEKKKKRLQIRKRKLQEGKQKSIDEVVKEL